LNKPILKLNRVALDFPSLSMPILSDINYEIYPEDFILILGTNGSGKSSLLKLISRQYIPTRGSIYLNGKNINKISKKIFRKKLGILTQDCHDSLFTELTILENYLLFGGKSSNKNNSIEICDYLAEFNAALSLKINQPVELLSGGEKQALALALHLINPPKILLLDEHTSALDPKTATQIMALTLRMAKKYKITCLLTTHNMEMAAEYGNRILALKQGKIYRTIERKDEPLLDSASLIAACF